MVKIFTTSNLLDQIKFIFNKKYERTNDIDEACVLLLPYSSKEKFQKELIKIPRIFIAVNSDDLEAFTQIQNSTLSLSTHKWERNKDIMILGKIGIEPNDSIIKLKNIEIGLKRDKSVFSYIYITEFHRKMEIEGIKEILEKYLDEVSSALTEETQYSKKVWSSIQRTLSFLFAFFRNLLTVLFLINL